jgi:hypothetical protein
MPSTPRIPDSRYPAYRDTAGRREEPTPSQLDRIAEVNARARRQARGNRGRWLAAVAGAAVLLALALGWQRDRLDESAPAGAQYPVAVSPVAAVQPSAASAAVLAPAVPEGAAAKAVPQAVSASAAASPPMPAVDRTRQLRAKQEAPARPKAVEQDPAPERSLADEQDRQRREAERARELADEASRRAAQAGPSRTVPAPEARRNVRELCSASSNLFSENACHLRECRKPDQQGDPTCVRLRELEEVQRLGGRQ